MISIALALAASATQSFWEGDSWMVSELDSGCSLSTLYEDGSVFWFSYDLGLNAGVIMITDKAFKSVTGDKKYKLNLMFSKTTGLDDAWGTVDAEGFTAANMKGVRIEVNGRQALNDIAASKAIALVRDDIIVTSLSLKGSGSAIVQLKRCAAIMQKRNPSDLLEGAEIK